tara:strand:- start:334 stop:762 length:429 start_codon:yes stop_codon:yes gene_type:complete
MVKLSLRMNLADILNNEEVIMEKLNEIHKNSIHFFLKLWYEEERLKLERIKDFAIKNEERLHFKTSIKPDRTLGPNDFIWFDIINIKYANESDRIRFQHTYNREEDILNCLEEFQKCAKFCTSEKPPKRIQKRNDNESSNYR